MMSKVSDQGRGVQIIDKIFTLKQIDEKECEKKKRVQIGFMDLEKAYDRINKERLWQVLRMYDVGGKLLNGIQSMYYNSIDCIKIKGAMNVSELMVV